MIGATKRTDGQDASKRLPSATLCRRALSVLHVGLLLVVDGDVAWANPAAHRLLGVDRGAADPWPAAVLQLAATLAQPRSRGSSSEMRALGSVRISRRRLRLCGVALPAVRRYDDAAVLLAVEPSGGGEGATPCPDDAKLRRCFHLTSQEVHVAHLLVDGLSNREVARVLGISPNTARIHTERVLRKLGVHSRAAVARALHRA